MTIGNEEVVEKIKKSKKMSKSRIDSAKRRRILRRVLALKIKGVKCIKCGYNKNISVMNFHHPNGRDIEHGKVIQRLGWEDFLKEIDKCVVLCSNCHQEEHHPELNIKDYDDEFLGFDIKREYCIVCGKELFEIGVEKYCSIDCRAFSDRRVDRPSKEVLEKEMAEMPLTALGKKYGVSDAAVKKWAKIYGIYEKKLFPIEEQPCVVCGTMFFPREKSHKYCSTTCMGKANLKVQNPPSQEDLIAEVKQSTYKNIAKKYGVSISTLQKMMGKRK